MPVHKGRIRKPMTGEAAAKKEAHEKIEADNPLQPWHQAEYIKLVRDKQGVVSGQKIVNDSWSGVEGQTVAETHTTLRQRILEHTGRFLYGDEHILLENGLISLSRQLMGAKEKPRKGQARGLGIQSPHAMEAPESQVDWISPFAQSLSETREPQDVAGIASELKGLRISPNEVSILSMWLNSKHISPADALAILKKPEARQVITRALGSKDILSESHAKEAKGALAGREKVTYTRMGLQNMSPDILHFLKNSDLIPMYPNRDEGIETDFRSAAMGLGERGHSPLEAAEAIVDKLYRRVPAENRPELVRKIAMFLGHDA